MSYYLPDEKTAPGWYTFIFLDGDENCDSIYAYFLDPEKYESKTNPVFDFIRLSLLSTFNSLQKFMWESLKDNLERKSLSNYTRKLYAVN